ncbi:hypothetical protein GXW82_12240 [Streptacidiphilus sp. 4-A2]|nr:hypothetical protein [Streptacidiphilus sp. 4-A2]
MISEDLHDFFTAAAGVAGTLIGLLFVAISVAAERVSEHGNPAHRVRAAGALTVFTNALTVSLFALVPGTNVGTVAFVVSLLGLMATAASLISLIRQGTLTWQHPREVVFPICLGAVFVAQLLAGQTVMFHPAARGSVITIAEIIMVCFLIGIARAWELVGGPQLGLVGEILTLVRSTPTSSTATGEQRPRTPPAGRDLPVPIPRPLRHHLTPRASLQPPHSNRLLKAATSASTSVIALTVT